MNELQLMKNNNFYLILCMISIIQCTQELTHPNQILAKVGKHTISVDQFTKSYSFGPSALKEGPNPKVDYLNAMINELFLYEMLSQNPQYSISQTDSRLMLLKDEYLVEKMFIENVNENIYITDEEIIESIKVSKKKLRISYLFTRFIDTAEKCLNVLNKGENYNQLTDELFEISDEFYIGETKYLVYGEIDEPLNSIIFSLLPGQISKIITTELGYYILRVDDIITDSISNMDFEINKNRHKKILWNKKGNILAKEYLDSFLSPKNIVVKAESFNTIVNELYPLYKQYNSLPNDIFKLIDEFKTMDKRDDWLDDTLVSYNSGDIISREIVLYLQRRPLFFDTKTINVFAEDFERRLAIIIRDHFLINDAIKKGYQTGILLENELNIWKNNLVVNDYINSIKKDLLSQSYNEKSNALDREIIREISEKTKVLINYKLDSLKTKIPLDVDKALLLNIEVDDQMIGHVPEVKLFKLGLPYFRLAYPSPNTLLGIIN